MNETTRFREVQRPPWWVWMVLVAVVAGLARPLYLILKEAPGRVPPSLWISMAVGLASLALPATFHLVTEVRSDHLYVAFRPLRSRRIPFEDIEDLMPVTYRPLAEYGGWGIKFRLTGRRGWAYTMSGNRGVRIPTRTGKELLIGSRRADELFDAIRSVGLPLVG